MTPRKTIDYCMKSLKRTGSTKHQITLSSSQKYELTSEAGKVSLLRTIFNRLISIRLIQDQKLGSTSLNCPDAEAIDKAIISLGEKINEGKPDSAHDIADYQAPEKFDNGVTSPDLEMMYKRLSEYLEYVGKHFPKISARARLVFDRKTDICINTNGVNFESTSGIYRFSSSVTAKENNKITSENFSWVLFDNLDSEIVNAGIFKDLLKQASELTESQNLSGKFKGDIIIAPFFVGWLISVIKQLWLGDGPVNRNCGKFVNKLGKLVASPSFTLHSKCLSGEIVDGYSVTPDGFKAADQCIIKNGILKSYLLTNYGAKKSGFERAGNPGACFVVDAGDTPYDDMIKSISKGLLITRVAGGLPSIDGDFSSVVKCGYYIENGKIIHPVSNVMISGNISTMLMNIDSISKEQINFGDSAFPAVKFTGINISGSE